MDDNPLTKMNPYKTMVALKGFFTLKEIWGLNDDQCMAILNLDAETYYELKCYRNRGVVGVFVADEDLTIRISLIIGIYKALHLLLNHTTAADRWIWKNNSVFDDQRAIDVLTTGHRRDLHRVHSHLHAVLAGN